ncbi:MAG: hypothetical protein HUK22_00985, partial [Thermoguttaceae bacterium]|nr:hypothetical protein [Thermoguttaceae bacterium]
MPSDLFKSAPPIWERADNDEILVARVAFPDGPDGLYDYRVPPRLENRVVPGVRVLAPLGFKNRAVAAYCVELERRPADAD